MRNHGKMWLAAAAVLFTAACNGTATTAPDLSAQRSVQGNPAVLMPNTTDPVNEQAVANQNMQSRTHRSGYLVASGRSK